MTRNSASLNDSMLAQSGWAVRATIENGARASRYFVALMKVAAARERTRRELASLDPHLLRDIGLEPLDVYYGRRGSGR
jgi:uncharacterized protein YjiS (DUF1127 family)